MSKFPLYKTISTDKLIPYARNSRTHSEEQVGQIAASIKEFGFLNPIIVDGENVIIAGHGRVLAAQKLGLRELPVVEASHLTDTQRRAYVIADNKLAMNAGWDADMLRIEIEQLATDGFELDLIGFSQDEIAQINLDIDDIEEVDHFNETFNFSITCSDLSELAMVQSALGASGKKIDAARLLELIK